MSNPFLERLYHRLPRIYRNADKDQKEQLKRYLDILVSGGFKPVYEETKGILSLIDFDNVPAKYLPHLASALGFEFPYDLDEQTQRTYIKNAVISYRIKGTEKALLFMIRELTRFKVDLKINEDERTLSVQLEVDPDRQDIDKMKEKVQFLVKEYAPPFGVMEIVNSFIWDEVFYKEMYDQLLETYMVSYSAYEPKDFLILNYDRGSILNSRSYNISNFDQYARYEVEYNYNDTLSQTKEDDLRIAKDDSFGKGQHTAVYPRLRESIYNKVWDSENELIHIMDKGRTSLIDDTAIVLNRLSYGLNDLNTRLSDVNVLDFNDQAYTNPQVDYSSFVDEISMEHKEIHTPNFTYHNYLFNVSFIHNDIFKQNFSYLEDTVRVNIFNKDDATITKAEMDYILNDVIRLAVEKETSHQQTTEWTSIIVAKNLLHTDDLIKTFEYMDNSHVTIFTDLKRDYNFVLVSSSTTGDANYQLVGQVEQLVRKSIEDTLNYDIIETGKIGTNYTETKSIRTEEYNGADDIQDEFTDKITYVNTTNTQS